MYNRYNGYNNNKYNYNNNYNKNKSENIKIRTLCSPEVAYVEISYFRTYLTLKFVPWVGKDHNGLDQYCKKTFSSTTLNPEGAAYFYGIAMSIVNGKEADIQFPAVLPCKNDTTLTLEYKPDENNQMAAFLVINKNNETISFKFNTWQTQGFVDGQPVTKVVQTELQEFAMILFGYIQRNGDADYLLSKPVGEVPKPEPTFVPKMNSGNNSNESLLWTPPTHSKAFD